MKEIDSEILKYAARADEISPEAAMDFLIQMYIDSCGISKSDRTIAENASWFWCEKMVGNNPDLPRDLELFAVAEMRSEEYRKYKEDIDRYDIHVLGFEDTNRIAAEIINEYESDTAKIAIAAGIQSWLKSFTSHPEENFKSINQSNLAALIAGRLESPEKFTGKPLVIFEAVTNDGVQDCMLREVFKVYNAGKPKEEWKSFLANPKRANADKLGLIIVDASEGYREIIQRYNGIPAVIYAEWLDDVKDILSDFPDAETYAFLPDFEQWADCIKDYKGIPRWLVDFIRGNGTPEDITYRWYNYFNDGCIKYLDISKDKNTGCDFPEKWLEGLRRLKMHMKSVRVDKYCKIPEDFFNMCFSTGISQDLKDELREYLKLHNY